VYPSLSDVQGSHDGMLGGGCLPYSRMTHTKQLWLQEFLHRWRAEKRHRTQATPHIKTYCRISPDMKTLAWFLLTSANLSKAAWGRSTHQGSGQNIMSYEAGVLFLPKFLVSF
jgi:tyrosyl-DNA phosphodiesterase-1